MIGKRQGRAQDFSRGGAQSDGHPASAGGSIYVQIRILIWNSGNLSVNGICICQKVRVARTPSPPPKKKVNHKKRNHNRLHQACYTIGWSDF